MRRLSLEPSAGSAAEVLEAPHGRGDARAVRVVWTDDDRVRSPVAFAPILSGLSRERSELSASCDRAHFVGLSLDCGDDRAGRSPLARFVDGAMLVGIERGRRRVDAVGARPRVVPT